MSAPKRILIVEDHYETIDFLRNAFNLLSERVDIIGILSGEEAWLELLRGDIDLLMVDLRLPGMSGSELLVRVQKRYPELPSIVMSGSAMEMMKRETAGLTIHRFIEKPMDIDALLEIVEATLFGRTKQAGFRQGNLPAEARQQLDQLQVDTGARQLLLATLSGDLIYQNGEETTLAEDGILEKIGQSMKSGLAVAHDLAAKTPRSIQYLSTGTQEFYFANIGSTSFVTLVYGAQNKRARIGTIWVFLQRAIRELQDLLAALPEPADLKGAAVDGLVIPAKVEPPPPEPPIKEDIPMGDPLTMEEALAQGLLPTEFAADLEPGDIPLDLFGDVSADPDEDAELALLRELAVPDEGNSRINRTPGSGPAADFTEADLDLLDENEEELDEVELEAFWEAAVDDQSEAADDPEK